MALTLTAKPSGAQYRYTWAVPLVAGDSVASYTLTPTGCTILASENAGETIEFLVSGGTIGTMASIAAIAVTADGEVLTETLYIPIRNTTNTLGNTARDACLFALRKASGMGNEPEADELADALERLNDMLAAWAGEGADIGIALPVAAGTVLLVSDAFIQAIKMNLILQIADIYEYAPSGMVVNDALRGLQRIKAANLPAERVLADFY